jgi:hypothetical protein
VSFSPQERFGSRKSISSNGIPVFRLIVPRLNLERKIAAIEIIRAELYFETIVVIKTIMLSPPWIRGFFTETKENETGFKEKGAAGRFIRSW